MQPKDFGELNGIEKFTYALFSKTENTTYEMLKPKFKYPFIFNNFYYFVYSVFNYSYNKR